MTYSQSMLEFHSLITAYYAVEIVGWPTVIITHISISLYDIKQFDLITEFEIDRTGFLTKFISKLTRLH